MILVIMGMLKPVAANLPRAKVRVQPTAHRLQDCPVPVAKVRYSYYGV